MAFPVINPILQFFDNVGEVLAGGLLYTYEPGTSTPKTTYTNENLSASNTNPIVLSSAGRCTIFTADSSEYKYILQTASGVTLRTEDEVKAPVGTQAGIGALLYPRTDGEIAVGVVPANYAHPPGYLLRYGNNTVPGVTDMAAAFQAAVDSADGTYPAVFLTDDVAISRPIIFRTTTQQSLSIIGTGRVSCFIRPLAADISTAPENVNALFVNKNNNLNLHMQGFRCHDSSAYTGKFMYAVENGGGDGLCQAMFSSFFFDTWYAFSSNNTGIFHGGFSNLMMTDAVFEGTKDACFILEGGGNGDLMFNQIVMNACYDSFIRQVDDGSPLNILQVDGLHVYQHLRGRIFDLTQATNAKVHGVQIEWDTSNVGDCWLARLRDSTINFSDCSATIESGTVRGDGGFDLVGSSSVTLNNVKITADVGLRVSGSGALQVVINNCDFSYCQYGFQQLSGTSSGKLCFTNTKINYSEQYGMLHSAGAPTFSIDFIYGEILNAGTTGIATSRNINLDTSGDVRFVGTRIGQDDANADAACYIRADGSGSFKVVHPVIAGTPPTSIVDASSTQPVLFVWEPSVTAKTFQLAAAASTVVPDTQVQASSHIVLTPTNAAAAVVMAGAKSLYVSARNAGASFTVTTADATSTAGTENFTYRVLP